MTDDKFAVKFELPGRLSLRRNLHKAAAEKRTWPRKSCRDFKSTVTVKGIVACFEGCDHSRKLHLDDASFRTLLNKLRPVLARYELVPLGPTPKVMRTDHETPNGECRLVLDLELTVY